ncbi:DUF2254 domain-containing protein [Tianweitania sp. BSSL-BM11]|uniref:DUF2254 domain-containing protein n=1 Tax=Tianweitania aestuarii TaxID=2814886 RepID=A0ABS5RV17_9HYPH|nr:DUF2254 domain-containing protein [Tianweitania aestuarii]MBS9720900.1 DUF2254 domain-containing protein [Tianweitania aestuarii]
MMSRWYWILSQLTRRMWFRASLFSLAAIGTALLAIIISPYIPQDLPTKIGADAVDNILTILASSMLAVTTFSLSTMVSAYSAATNNVTPRATRLVIEDTTTQNMLSTFVGSFLFSLVGIIVLSTGAYGESGRVVLFAVTIFVVVLIVLTLLRWIDHLSRLGRVTETTERVESATAEAMRVRKSAPFLGGNELVDLEKDVPASARPIYGSSIGYVQHVDAGGLQDIAENGKGRIYVAVIPGQFTTPMEPIAWADSVDDDNQESSIRGYFTVGDTRSFDQDPRFGASVLSEIASRALSPGINDPGTAIDVIGRAVRVLSIWAHQTEKGAEEVRFPNLYVPGIAIDDLFDDLFTPIARDGAPVVEVGLRLQKALRDLATLEGESRYLLNAKKHSRLAMERAEQALVIDDDKHRLRAVASKIAEL